jgi:SAM-dependent methyltransferase
VDRVLRDDLLALWRREEAAPFTGWDFSYIAARRREERSPWSYEDEARSLLSKAGSAVDLGTGGGEVLASLSESFPRLTVATEAYPPNVGLAARRLTPLGARVVAYGLDLDGRPTSAVQDRAAALPFREASFDVVLSRHEAYDARDVARVLVPGGTFLTQQVDGRSLGDLTRRFGVAPQWPGVTVEHLSAELVGADLAIEDARSWWGTVSFSDVGALVYYLKAVPWTVPGFSVSRYEAVLLELQREVETAGTLRFGQGSVLIQASKPR